MYLKQLWTKVSSAGKKLWGTEPSQPYQYQHQQFLCSSEDKSLYAPSNYRTKYPRYAFIPGETIERFEERACRMSRITSTSIVNRKWCPGETSEWVYQFVVSIGVKAEVALCEANHFDADGGEMIYWRRQEYGMHFRLYADVIYDRVQKIKSEFPLSERRIMACVHHHMYVRGLHYHPLCLDRDRDTSITAANRQLDFLDGGPDEEPPLTQNRHIALLSKQNFKMRELSMAAISIEYMLYESNRITHLFK